MLRRLCFVLLLGALASPEGDAAGTAQMGTHPLLIAFGSCLRQQAPQPVWKTLRALAPDALVLGGDNVYADTGSYLLRPEPERIGTAYAELAANPDWAALRAQLPLYATWDDHDYGRNDAGAEYPHKLASKAFFMDFFHVPADAAMRSRDGVYDVHWIERDGRQIQLLLLDTRSFRSPLVKAARNAACPTIRWGRSEAPGATMLGEAQWTWLAGRLAAPADLHLLVSSIQVIPDEHCYEKWANFPRERERLLSLIDGASAPVLILSGDRHLGEISRMPANAARHWPLLELTSSGLNSARVSADAPEPNRYRALPGNVRVDNFATIGISWRDDAPSFLLALRDSRNGGMLQQLEARLTTRP